MGSPDLALSYLGLPKNINNCAYQFALVNVRLLSSIYLLHTYLNRSYIIFSGDIMQVNLKFMDENVRDSF